MLKPRYRQIKKQVEKILQLEDREEAFDKLQAIPMPQLTAPLFSIFYTMDDLIKFRSTVAMGDLTARLAKNKMEDARIILRRLMWNLNDESGGIGWGSVEAMGEILKRDKTLAKEFEKILFSYINPEGNFLEHEMLQRGLLWGVGTYLEKCVSFDTDLAQFILPFLDSNDPVKRGYAVRALINMDKKQIKTLPESIISDKNEIFLFDGWNLLKKMIGKIHSGTIIE